MNKIIINELKSHENIVILVGFHSVLISIIFY